jgi:glycosyltransferase involved in cell wall biosynthesis
VVGFLGRLDPTKGIETLLAALRALRGLPVEAASAGRGQPGYEAGLRDAAADLPARFLGHVEPREFLAGVDVLVVPSVWQEPFGRVVPEAFSSGVPVVGSDAGGIPESIGPGGPGFLFPPGDADRLAAILRRLVVEGFPAERMSEACLARSADFALDNVLDEHVALYRRVLDGAAAAGSAKLGLVPAPFGPGGLGGARPAEPPNA